MVEPAFSLNFPGLGPGEKRYIRLYLEDCLSGMRKVIEPGSIDVIVTSPPYNIGVQYNYYHDHRPGQEYLNWIREVAGECGKVLKQEGSFFLNVGQTPSDPWLAWDIAQTLRDLFILQNVIIWVKAIAVEKEDVGSHSPITMDVAIGHYKPISGARFLHDCFEYIFHFTKTGQVELDRLAIGIPYQDKSNIGRWKIASKDRRCRGNVWFIPYETIKNREQERPHPSTFPVKLPELCLRLHGLPAGPDPDSCRDREAGGIVALDPFMGLGSTAIACLRLGISCLGFEVDPKYLEIAGQRIMKEPRLLPGLPG